MPNGPSLALAALSLAAPGPMPVALAPTGQWLLEGQDNMCALSHPFGAGRDAVTLAVRPWPLGGSADVVLFTLSSEEGVRDGKASLAAGDVSPPPPSRYTSFALTRGRGRMLSFPADAHLVELLENAPTATVTVDGRPLVLRLPPTTGAALGKLRDCGRLLLAHLGVDTVALGKVVTPATPIGRAADWFSPADYPTNAMRGGAQGVSRLLMTIGTEGRVTACTTFGSSGNPEMDVTACDKFRTRGRYRPATDAAGRPVVSYVSQSVRWEI